MSSPEEIADFKARIAKGSEASLRATLQGLHREKLISGIINPQRMQVICLAVDLIIKELRSREEEAPSGE